MNNITQIKRGSTASWSLGPEMVHWENLDVWGKDSLIHCEGTNLQMNVYTASANYFYDENGQLEDFKRPGLWLIKTGEIGWDTSAQVEFKCWTNGPSDCWLEVAAPNAPSIHGQRIPLGQQAQMTVPFIGEWGLYIRWPEQREITKTADIKISIRQVGAYEELAPGQLGVEYTEDGQVKLKVGKPDISKWNELPYIGSGGGGAQEPIIVKYSEERGLSHTSQEIYDLVSAGRIVYFSSEELTNGSLFALVRTSPDVAWFTSSVADDCQVERIEIYGGRVWRYDNELVYRESLSEYVPTKHLEILPTYEHSYGVNILNEDSYVVENGQPIETLTFYGSGGDEPVRLRHLAPGSQNDDAVTVGQVMEFAQGMQSDWNVEDPQAYNYIKNKPFGRIEQTILFDGDATFSQPDIYGNCYYYFDKPLTLIDEKSYFIDGYGYFSCQNGQISLGPTPIIFYSDYILISAGTAGGNTYRFTIIDLEPSYKTLAIEYLPMVHNAEIDNTNPISSHGVANIVEAFSAQLGNIEEALDTIIAIQQELIGLITFTIANTEYQAEDGMTWVEWVGSTYDTKPHIILLNDYVSFEEGGMHVYLNDYSRPVYQNEIIQAGYAYIYD